MPTAPRGSVWIAAFLLLLVVFARFAGRDAQEPALTVEQAWQDTHPSSFIFERNRGQGPSDATLLARGPGLSAALASDFLRVRSKTDQFEIRFRGAASQVPPVLAEPLGTVSYLRGRDPGAWVHGAPRGARAGFAEIYPGVRLDYYTAPASIRAASAGDAAELEYDFTVSPGADASAVRMLIDRPVSLDAAGDLRLSDGHALRKPVAYQVDAQGERRQVGASYRLLADGSVGFSLEEYDRDRPLVIDPRVGLSSYLGGSGNDRPQAVQAAPDGSLWIAGYTDSPDFPQPANAFPYSPRGGLDVFLTQLERGVTPFGEPGWRIKSSVFLGGAGDDRAVDIEIDDEGNLHVFGDTRSADFPITTEGLQRDLRGGADLFYVVLRETDFPFFTVQEEGGVEQSNPTNYELEYGTLAGGAADDVAEHGMLAPFAPEPSEPCAVIVGVSDSDDFPVTVFPAQRERAGAADGVFTALCRPPGTEIFERTYATYFGGVREDSDTRAAVSPEGAFCLGIRTSSDGLPADGFQQQPGGNTDVYLGCFTPTRRQFGLPFLYRQLGRTYFGAVGSESLHGLEIESTGPPIDLDPSFRVIAVLESNAEDLPTPDNLPDPPPGGARQNPGSRSILVTAFTQFLNERLIHFWVGGLTAEQVADIDYSGRCLALAGRSASADLALSDTFPQRQIAGGTEALAAKFCFDENLQRAETEYLGFYGSTAEDRAQAVTMLGSGAEVYVGAVVTAAFGVHEDGSSPKQSVEQSSGPGWPLTPGAPQRLFGGGGSDGFVFELFRPRLTPQAIVHSADFSSGGVAPGEILSLFGAGFGPQELVVAQPDAEGRLPRRLGSTRVLFNDAPAPMLFATANQISAVAPFFLDGRSSVVVQVEVDGAPSLPLTIPVVPVRPAVFTLDQSGAGQAAVLNQDSSVNGPQNGASPGSAIQIFLSGAGQTQPPGVDGELVPLRQPFPQILAPVTVRVGGVDALVIYQGAAPGLVNGLTQINAILSRELGTNPAATLEITVGGVPTQPGATVAVR